MDGCGAAAPRCRWILAGPWSERSGYAPDPTSPGQFLCRLRDSSAETKKISAFFRALSRAYSGPPAETLSAVYRLARPRRGAEYSTRLGPCQAVFSHWRRSPPGAEMGPRPPPKAGSRSARPPWMSALTWGRSHISADLAGPDSGTAVGQLTGRLSGRWRASGRGRRIGASVGHTATPAACDRHVIACPTRGRSITATRVSHSEEATTKNLRHMVAGTRTTARSSAESFELCSG